MVVFRRKQIIVLTLILLVVIAGYVQYNYEQEGTAFFSKNNASELGEAVYVDGKNISLKNKDFSDECKDNDCKQSSKQVNDFFTQAKMDKEKHRAQNKEMLKAILADENVGKEEKSKAYSQMMKLVSDSEKEAKIEMLVKEKGFGNVVAILGEGGNLDILIKSPELNSVQVAQISEIGLRHANINLSDIHIKNIY